MHRLAPRPRRLPLPVQSSHSYDFLCVFTSQQSKQHFFFFCTIFISHVNVCISNKRIICASLLPIFISIKVVCSKPNYIPINSTHALPFKFIFFRISLLPGRCFGHQAIFIRHCGIYGYWRVILGQFPMFDFFRDGIKIVDPKNFICS